MVSSVHRVLTGSKWDLSQYPTRSRTQASYRLICNSTLRFKTHLIILCHPPIVPHHVTHISLTTMSPPPSDIQEFLYAFLENHPDLSLSNMNILDPCAWWNPETDTIPEHPMSYPLILAWYKPYRLITNDIRPDSPAQFHEDFITYPIKSSFDMIITNPPFNLALPIIEKALDILPIWGYCIMLLRLNFFGSKARKKFFESNMPIETYVHHKRISFAKSATDSIEYMHCVWKKGENPPFTKLYLI